MILVSNRTSGNIPFLLPMLVVLTLLNGCKKNQVDSPPDRLEQECRIVEVDTRLENWQPQVPLLAYDEYGRPLLSFYNENLWPLLFKYETDKITVQMEMAPDAGDYNYIVYYHLDNRQRIFKAEHYEGYESAGGMRKVVDADFKYNSEGYLVQAGHSTLTYNGGDLVKISYPFIGDVKIHELSYRIDDPYLPTYVPLINPLYHIFIIYHNHSPSSHGLTTLYDLGFLGKVIKNKVDYFSHNTIDYHIGMPFDSSIDRLIYHYDEQQRLVGFTRSYEEFNLVQNYQFIYRCFDFIKK